MIEQRYNLELSNGTAPYTYVLVGNAPCISFLRNSGTTDSNGAFTVTIFFTNETCLNAATVTVSGFDSLGCPFEEVIPLESPCDTLSISSISDGGDYQFSVAAADSSSASVEFSWIYDTALFSQVSLVNGAFTSTITLSPKTGVVLPATTSIQAKAKNTKGCAKTAQLTYAFCRPTALSFTANLYCTDEITFISSNLVIPNPEGCSSDIDWDTVAFSLPTGISAEAADGSVQFSGTSLTSGTYSGSYSVKTTEGVPSTTGSITIVVNPCDIVKTISFPDKTWYLDCDVLPGDVVELNIEDEYVLVPGTVVDWSTWSRIEPPISVSPMIELATNSDGDHVIRYTVPSPFAADSFGWTVADTNGIYANAIAYTISACAEIPSAVNDTFTVSCDSTTELDVLANDIVTSSPIALDSVEIVTAPTLGEVTVTATGTLNYTIAGGISGVDTLEYRFKNVHGTYSNTATVAVTIECAGSDAFIELCN